MKILTVIASLLLAGCLPKSQPPRYIETESFVQWQGKTVSRIQPGQYGTELTIVFTDAPPLTLTSYKYSMKVK